ncbi:MAG: acyl-CoA dehydrogenase family protein [Burkholderiales bacterium]|nr:acyl-CoA dehydrogenase family protein [Burkholderiales bacterium]
MDFSLSPEQETLRARVGAFIRERIIPLERDQRQGPHGPDDGFRRELNAAARAADLLAPHVGREWGGLGLDHVSCAIVFEAAGYSPIGPIAMNCSAPDEGNMHMLELIATEAQKQRFLRPLAAGETRSCFAMTEPIPGAGADPDLLRTEARRDGDCYVVNGRKWLITGARGAAFAIIMARAEEGATMLLSDMSAPGIRIERILDTIDQGFAGGHAVLSFEDLRIPVENVLGAPGEGFKYAQVRLAPARLTHCMRWLGAACRAHDIARRYAAKRHAFGKPIGEHEGVGFMLADNELDLHQCRLAVWHCAWLLDQGASAGSASSMAKVICSEALFRVADRCVQILGGLGVTQDTVVERIFREIRAFRIYDGPSEVHRWALARRALRGAGEP